MIIISEYSSGFGNYSVSLSNALQESEDVVYLSDKKNLFLDSLDEKVTYVPLFETFNTNYKKGGLLWALNRSIVTIKNAVRRYKFVKKNNPRVIIIQAMMSAIDWRFIKKLKKHCKVMMTVHDVIVPTKSKSWSMKSLKRMYGSGDVLIVHSEVNKKQLIDFFNIDVNKVRVIPHGIDPMPIIDCNKDKAKQHFGISNNKKTFLFYGSIRETKGLDVLIKAFKGIDGNLLITGAPQFGDSFDKYQQLINDNNVNAFTAIRFLTKEETEIAFTACDFIVLPYLSFFSQSGVLMQCVQFNKPVIVTNVSEFKGFVERYDIGYVCEPSNIEELHSKLDLAIKENKDFSNGLKVAFDNNSWERSAQLYFEASL